MISPVKLQTYCSKVEFRQDAAAWMLLIDKFGKTKNLAHFSADFYKEKEYPGPGLGCETLMFP